VLGNRSSSYAELVRQLLLFKKKVKQFRYRSGLEGSRSLRFPDCMTTAQDGGKFVSLTHR
jgi:hypothetical protein